MIMKIKFILPSLLALCISANSMAQANAIAFNGTSEYAQIVNAELLNISNELTIEAWVQLNKVDGNNFIVGKQWCGNSQFAYAFSIADGKVRWVWNSDGNCNNSSYVETANVVFNASECHHLAVTHTTTSVKIYVDGIEVSSNLVQGNYSYIASSTEPFRIGIYKGLSGSFAYFMNGKIDELKVWNTVRTQQQIYNYKNLVLNGNEPNLVAYFDFEGLSNGAFVTIPNKALSTGSLLNAETSSNAQFQSSCAVLTNLEVNETDNNDPENKLTIQPNPTFSELHVVFNKSSSNETLQLYSINGQKLKEFQVTGFKTTLDVTNLDKGVYFLNLRGNPSNTSKFIKE